eukprot:scaffold4749_cov137-Isochrysis_galbana.AAC.2
MSSFCRCLAGGTDAAPDPAPGTGASAGWPTLPAAWSGDPSASSHRGEMRTVPPSSPRPALVVAAPPFAQGLAAPPSPAASSATRPSSGHFHHSGESASTACTYINMASILLRFPSSTHAEWRARAMESNMLGRGSLHGPCCAWRERASKRRRSASVRSVSCISLAAPKRRASSNLSG